MGGNAVLKHHFFKHLVVRLTLKNTEHDSWVTELASSNVLTDFSVEFATIVLFLHLDPVGLLDLDSELFGRLAHVVVDGVGSAEDSIVVLVDHDPLLFEEIASIHNRLLAEGGFITVDHLLLVNHLHTGKHLGVNGYRCFIDFKLPLLH